MLDMVDDEEKSWNEGKLDEGDCFYWLVCF